MKRFLITLCISFTFLFGCTDLNQYSNKQVTVEYSKENEKDIKCLTDNIYYESKGESYEGNIAVAFVTLNRLNHEKFPKDICGVVKQKRNGVCQFSWHCTKSLTAKTDLRYNYFRKLAEYIFHNHKDIEDPTNGALFFHATYVNPKWKNMEKTATIGKHIFYVNI
jgi:spore germination cell wall hydrolase CwlJ-like protein